MNMVKTKMDLIGNLVLLVGVNLIYASPDISTGSIEGFLVSADLGPISGSEIKLLDTGFVTLTDSTGHFYFTDIPPGQYDLHAEAMNWHYSPYGLSRKVIVIAGDTTIANVLLSERRYEYYRSPIERDIFWEPLNLHFNISVPEGRSSDGFWITSNSSISSICRATRLDENVFSVEVSPDYGEFTWSLPWMGERRVYVRDSRTTRNSLIELDALPVVEPQWIAGSFPMSPLDEERFPLAVLDHTADEWISEDFIVEHDVIDPRRYGDEKLLNYGLVTQGFYFPSQVNEPWVLAMVFRTRIAVIKENGSEVETELPILVKRALLSSNCQFSLLNASEAESPNTGEYMLLDVNEGKLREFPQVPEDAEMLSGVSFSSHGMNVGYSISWSLFEVSDTGKVICLTDDVIRTFDASGNLLQVFSADSITASDNSKACVAVSPNGSHWAAMISYLGQDPVLLIDGEQVSSFDLTGDSILADATLQLQWSNGGTYIALANRTGYFGIANKDIPNTTRFPFEGACELPLCFSRNDSLFACVTGVDIRGGDNSILITGTDIPFEENRSFPGYSTFWYKPRTVALNNEGWTMLCVSSRANDSIHRYAIFDHTGDLIWSSPYNTVTDPLTEFAAASPDGYQFSYNDGELTHLLTFERKPD